MPDIQAAKIPSEVPVDGADEQLIRVLLVDDDKTFRALCKRFLQNRTDRQYEVIEAASGAEACGLYSRGDIDCVLIDYRLPDATGTGVMRTLQPGVDPGTPMIVLTAAGSEEVATESLHAGAADYLPKSRITSCSLRRAIDHAVDKARLHRSIAERRAQLEAANIQLQKRNDEIRRFYHTISHEIKTPLTAAREFIALVADGVVGPATDRQQEMLSHALDSCDQIAQHFNDLIESTQLEIGKMRIRKRLGSVDQTLTRSIMSVAPTVAAKGLRLERQIEPNLPDLNIDTGRIVQVLSNLLGNAVKFTESGGCISIAARRCVEQPDYVEIEVRDTGCGISAEHIARIFDRLYQVQTAGDALMGAGLGLGLSIAKDIVDLHDGDIAVRSESGVGTSFFVRLPIPQDTDATQTLKENQQ